MIIAQKNHTVSGTLLCNESTDIGNLKDNITSNSALITPVAGTAVVDFIPTVPAKLNTFVWHAHTSTETTATITTERFSDGAHSVLIDSKTEPFVPVYTGDNVIVKPQERKQRVTMFPNRVPLRDISTATVGSIRFTITNHPSAFEVGMLGIYEGIRIKNGHVSGGIRDVTNEASTQVKTSTTHGGGVSSVQRTVIPDYAYALKDFTSAEKETFLDIARSVNQSFPFLLVPISSFYFDGKNYAHPGEEGGILRFTAPIKFDIASAMKGDNTDRYHAQNFRFRRWI